MTDRMHVVAPFGVLGAAVGRVLLQPYLRRPDSCVSAEPTSLKEQSSKRTVGDRTVPG